MTKYSTAVSAQQLSVQASWAQQRPPARPHFSVCASSCSSACCPMCACPEALVLPPHRCPPQLQLQRLSKAVCRRDLQQPCQLKHMCAQSSDRWHRHKLQAMEAPVVALLHVWTRSQLPDQAL